MLAAVPLAAVSLIGAVTLPAQAAERTAQHTSFAAEAAAGPAVTVHLDKGASGFQVANAIHNISESNRTKFVQKAVDAAFDASGGRFSVLIMNLSQTYRDSLQGVRLYANIEYGPMHYGLWIAESGEFANTGDAGQANWGFRGWFERSGNTVKFRHP
jgi:hypothetical protein